MVRTGAVLYSLNRLNTAAYHIQILVDMPLVAAEQKIGAYINITIHTLFEYQRNPLAFMYSAVDSSMEVRGFR